MNRLKTNDPLDAMLREQNQYIEDNGFTARVISALPRRRASFGIHRIILLAAVVIGAVLAVFWLPWKNLPAANWPVAVSFNAHLLLPWLLVLSVMGSLIWAAIAAVQWED